MTGIDEDYVFSFFSEDLNKHQKFYSRSFGDDNGKITKRIHFFKEEFSLEKFKKSLKNNDIVYLKMIHI